VTRACIAALLLGIAGLQAAARAETILFVGNSFTAGSGSAVERFRPDTVTDLNREGVGGVPALFEAFTRQAGLDYDVHLEVSGGMNLDYHFEQKGNLIKRAWDHVVLQGYSTLDADAPGDPRKIVAYAGMLAAAFHDANPRVDVRLVATWSRADQVYKAAGPWSGKPIEAMALEVRAAYDAAAASSPQVRAVIPVGQAWNRAIAEGLAASNPYRKIAPELVNLWADDGYHASTYGSYLAALVIFGSVTGRDPRSLGPAEEAAVALGLAPAAAQALQHIAADTLADEPGHAAGSAPAASLPPGTWQRVAAASDEFDGNALDGAKWKMGLWYATSGVLAFRSENVTVAGGQLILAARREAFQGSAYTAAAVESHFDVPGADSYVEIRAKALDRQANVLSAIWMQSSPLTVAANPNPEIDIQETFDYHGVVSTLHTWGIDPDRPAPVTAEEYIHAQTPPHEFGTGVDVSADFHVYGLERRDGKLRIYFDGRLAWEVVPPDPSFVNMPRHVVLSLEGHLGDPVPAHLPKDFRVDYVRTYVPAAD
jgi:beta-glucanase (GH16 family)